MNNTRKNILKLSAVISLIGVPVASMAGTVSLSLNSYSFGAGGEAAGEFSASIGSSATSLASMGYASSTINGTGNNASFETFCVQNSVFVNTGTSYNYTDGQSTGPNSVEGGIALSEGAAFLYYEFATGNLTGYNYANTSGGRVTTAGELQSAIWYFMGESSTTPAGWPAPSGDQFVTLADSILGIGNTTLADGSGGTNYNVSIMQMTSPANGQAVQNQLILGGNIGGNGNGQPVPDGGLTVAALGMSLAGLFIVQSKRNKAVFNQSCAKSLIKRD